MGNSLEKLEKLPRAILAHTPTPIEHLPNLSVQIGGAALYVKRDDCTGLALGGNKARQLEYYVGDALSQNADTILITGAVQSNFVRAAAAAAARYGLACHIQLEERVKSVDALYRNSGNVLLNQLLGATIHSYPDGEDESGADRSVHEIADVLRTQGRRPYVIPLAPGHPPLGALGYVVAAQEIVSQLTATDRAVSEIVVASGSGHTHAGLLFGLRMLGSSIRVLGICVRRDSGAQALRIQARCNEIAELLKIQSLVADSDINLRDEFLGPGYGQLNLPTREAIKLAAHHEALLLDPVYTGKAFAGCLQRAQELDSQETLLFVHTGGIPGIFAYGAQLLEGQ